MQITLEGGYSVAFMLAVAAAAIALAGLFYYRAFSTLKRGQWQLLLGLRAAAIVIVVLLLFRPVFSYQLSRQEKPAIVFLLDTSASMSIADSESGAQRFQLARDQVAKWQEQMKDEFTVHLMEFDQRARALENPSQLNLLAPKGKATSLSTAMLAASQRLPKKEIEAIVLLSDGIHNSARSPTDVAGKLGVVVHTVGVGASLRSNRSFRDIQVTGIDCPDRLMINNKAKITGSVDGVGLGGRVIKVLLDEDGKQIQEAELTLDDVEGGQKVEFEFRPTVKGRHAYTVRVAPLPEEKIQENNQRSAVAMVIEPGIRVLYIEGTTRREYAAISSWFLPKDPDLEFCSMYQTRQNTFVSRGNIADLNLKSIPSDAETINKFDVIILGDLDSSYLKPDQQQLILRRIHEGAGLLMLGGYHTLGPGGYAAAPLGEALPVHVGGREIGQLTDPFLPQLTPEGVRHPIFANISGFFPTKTGAPKDAGLPDLDGCTKIEGAKPGASVLATHPLASDMPVLAVQPLEKGRVAVFCGDTTWKWQQGPRALDQESPFLRFWGQMVRWLAGRTAAVEAKASITATTDKGFYDPDEPVKISAVVRDEKGEGATSAKIIAKVTDPTKHTDEVPMSVVPGPGGHFGGSYPPKMAGKYELVVEAKVGELTLTSEKLAVEAGRVNLEFEKLDMDEKTLQAIADASHGRYVHITAADSLVQFLDRAQRQKTERLERALFWPPGFWLLFVAVLTVEWVLRRRFQLR